MKKWFSRHYKATKTVISERWASEVSLKIVPAHLPEIPAVAQEGKARQGPADGLSWESKMAEAAIMQRKWELQTERILEMCGELPSRIQLTPAHGCKETKEAGERTARKDKRLQFNALTHTESRTVHASPCQTGKYHDSGDTQQSTKGLTQSWELISLKLSTVLGLPNKS